MRIMYSNLGKSHTFPLAMKVSSKPRCLKRFHTEKPQFLPLGCLPKPSEIPICVRFSDKFNQMYHLPKPFNYAVEFGNVVKPRSAFRGFRSFSLVRAENYSSFSNSRVGGASGGVRRSGKSLPWLASNKTKEGKGFEKVMAMKGRRSSWKESAKGSENGSSISSWEHLAEKNEEGTYMKGSSSSWKESAKTPSGKNVTSAVLNKVSWSRMVNTEENRKSDYVDREVEVRVEEEDDEKIEVVDDPRWDRIQNRFRGVVDVKGRSENPQFRKWDRQENWGRKTWKEATESSVPKMVGEGIYGVGPVLAALSAVRREFYALYVQEGLDLSSNNRKKKDKKGFEKILRMAEKLGVRINEISKHDLNMVVDSRPHQGLVLDASSLEMVKIKKLDPVSHEEENGSLWVALDEVSDPHNLGAIIRSAYFLGASGIVLCAKNSAPLSGVVSKASAGSLELMELRYCKNMMQFLTSSAENGWRVLGGSVSSRAIPLKEVPAGAPTILVLGSEGTGLRPLVERSCTQLIKISGNAPVDVTARGGLDAETVDTNHGGVGEEFQTFLAVESLNVSVAAGVLIHHLIGNNNNMNLNTGNESTIALE